MAAFTGERLAQGWAKGFPKGGATMAAVFVVTPPHRREKYIMGFVKNKNNNNDRGRIKKLSLATCGPRAIVCPRLVLVTALGFVFVFLVGFPFHNNHSVSLLQGLHCPLEAGDVNMLLAQEK